MNAEIFQTNLERCSYRYLQQTAKAMGLPCKLKKVFLVELIITKNTGTPRELEKLVQYVRKEQQQRSLARRLSTKTRTNKMEHNPEISSTNSGLSPPIATTPKRAGDVYIQFSPKEHSPIKFSQIAVTRRLPMTSSDRVLRSSNSATKPSYLLNSTLLTLLQDSDTNKKSEAKVRSVRSDENKKKATNRIFTNMIIKSWQDDVKRALAPKSEDISPPLAKRARRLSGIYPLQAEDVKLPSVTVRKADGTMSKINAFRKKPFPQITNYDIQPRRDRLNRSILRAPPPVISTQNSYRSTMQNSNYTSSNVTTAFIEIPPRVITAQTSGITTSNISLNGTKLSQSICYPPKTEPTRMLPKYNARLSSGSDETTISSTSKESTQPNEEYYHKKIRLHQVRESRISREMRLPPPAASVENHCRLPTISEAFKFNDVYSDNATRPLYIDTENAMAPNLGHITEPRFSYQGGMSLENIYYKGPHQQTRQIYTTTNTKTVFCTPIITTATAQPTSAIVVHDAYNVASPQREFQPFYTKDHDAVPRAREFYNNFHYHEYNAPPREFQPFYTNEHDGVLRANEFYHNFHYHEHNNNDASTLDFQRSCSSVETITSQEMEAVADINIPEMVEDALEIISQDGDYMERMGMDIRMQCILCNWAGPKIILEYHIRNHHSTEIIDCDSNEFSASYTLGELWARNVWMSHVLQLEGTLYVLSARYEDPDYFMAALTTVSYNPDVPKTGSLTIYNRVTGEPFTWTGAIVDLPPNMPYENNPYCFRLRLSKMDLLPNSANLKFKNKEFVTCSSNKVFVGRPELNNIQINLWGKIFN